MGKPDTCSESQGRDYELGAGRCECGYRYSVLCNGELLVLRSADPARDAACALKAKGITGKLLMLDGKTGRPRYTVNIEKAAGMTVREDRGKGPTFAKWKPSAFAGRQALAVEARSLESTVPGIEIPEAEKKAV